MSARVMHARPRFFRPTLSVAAASMPRRNRTFTAQALRVSSGGSTRTRERRHATPPAVHAAQHRWQYWCRPHTDPEPFQDAAADGFAVGLIKIGVGEWMNDLHPDFFLQRFHAADVAEAHGGLFHLALIVVVALWVLDLIASAFGAPARVVLIIKAILALIALLVFLEIVLGGGWSGFYPSHR